jgi:hypothetical protein
MSKISITGATGFVGTNLQNYLKSSHEIVPMSVRYKPNQDLSNWAKHTLAINKDAADFVTFRVDHTGSVEESFQSSTGETDIAQKFNSASAQGRAAKFSLFGGNIDGGPLDAVKNGLSSIIEGGISGIPFIGSTIMPALKAGAGAAYADIPEYWQNSSASMPRMSYTMQLVAPYGNPLSQMINIYIPLCMILAGALPLSTGKQSYTSPFLCQVFDQGRCQNRYSIINEVDDSEQFLSFEELNDNTKTHIGLAVTNGSFYLLGKK